MAILSKAKTCIVPHRGQFTILSKGTHANRSGSGQCGTPDSSPYCHSKKLPGVLGLHPPPNLPDPAPGGGVWGGGSISHADDPQGAGGFSCKSLGISTTWLACPARGAGGPTGYPGPSAQGHMVCPCAGHTAASGEKAHPSASSEDSGAAPAHATTR